MVTACVPPAVGSTLALLNNTSLRARPCWCRDIPWHCKVAVVRFSFHSGSLLETDAADWSQMLFLLFSVLFLIVPSLSAAKMYFVRKFCIFSFFYKTLPNYEHRAPRIASALFSLKPSEEACRLMSLQGPIETVRMADHQGYEGQHAAFATPALLPCFT